MNYTSDRQKTLPYGIIMRGDVTPKLAEIEAAAIKAAKGAYSPYSNFSVGAAVRLSNNEIVAASNQENASYPLGQCAERNTLFYAGAQYPDAAVEALIVVAFSPQGRVERISPCGGCRQVMLEMATRHKTYPVYLAGADSILLIPEVQLLLPFAFVSDDLNQ